MGEDNIFNRKSFLIIGVIFLIIIPSCCFALNNNSSDGNFNELSDIINKSSSGDTVVLSKNYINSDNYSSAGIGIDADNIIIKGADGKQITIDATNVGRIFNANNAQNITFENIKFINANSSDAGGAILLDDDESNRAVNCVFENCYSDTFGGALNGHAQNCTFRDCSAKYHGGAIFNGSAEDCIFNNCFSTSNGGAMSYNEAINCQFIDCYSYWRGGALYEADAFNCKFNNCFSSEGGSMYGGSAFCCYFEMSGAKNGNGGGMNGGTALACTFVSCYVNNGTGSAMYGGTGMDCNFESNTVSNVSISDTNLISYNFEDSFIKKLLS